MRNIHFQREMNAEHWENDTESSFQNLMSRVRIQVGLRSEDSASSFLAPHVNKLFNFTLKKKKTTTTGLKEDH